MKFFQKILFAMMICVFAGNVDGMQFSDPRLPAPPVVVAAGGILAGLAAERQQYQMEIMLALI